MNEWQNAFDPTMNEIFKSHGFQPAKLLGLSIRTRDIVSTIASHCVEGQSLSKDQVMELIPQDWDRNWTYTNLREHLPEAFSFIEGGPRGLGGFQSKVKMLGERKDYPCQPYEADKQGLDKDDLLAVAKLCELLDKAALETLVGKGVLGALRSFSRISETKDLSFNKEALATMLIIREGKSLFSDEITRMVVNAGNTKASGVKCKLPGRWCPGKDGSIKWINEVRFPLSYAGAKSELPPPPSEVLRGHKALAELADFQIETRNSALKQISKVGRCIISLPTGAGKTRTAMDIVCSEFQGEYDHCVVFWIAHTVELLEQAIECINEVWGRTPGLGDVELHRFYGRYSSDCDPLELFEESTQINQVIFATPISLMKRLLDWQNSKSVAEQVENWCDLVKLIVIDEAHRAAAPGYKQILDEFADRRAKVLGLTATPFRKEYIQSDEDTQVLRDLFLGVAEPDHHDRLREMLQERGVLARPVEQVLKSRVNLVATGLGSAADLDSLEKIDKSIGKQADRPDRRSRVLLKLLEYCSEPGSRILYFGPSVNDAQIVAFLLRSKRIASGSVSGETSSTHRRTLIRDFRAGKIQVLCNCEVLTTGFDCPAVTHVVIARPTVSQVLYEQMVGRGLRGRQFGGTDSCIILNVEDNFEFNGPKIGYTGWRKIWGLS